MEKSGVQIYLSWEEYLAICGARSELITNCEGADEEYVQNVQSDIKHLSNVCKKFKRAKYLKSKKI